MGRVRRLKPRPPSTIPAAGDVVARNERRKLLWRWKTAAEAAALDALESWLFEEIGVRPLQAAAKKLYFARKEWDDATG